MIQEAIYFWLSVATVVFSVLAIIFISLYKRYERENLINGVNFATLAIFLVVIVGLINTIRFANISYSITLNALLPGIYTLVPIMVSFKNLFLYPAIAVMFLVSAIIYRR